MRGVIRLGDPHSHGGKVATASGALFAGKKVMPTAWAGNRDGRAPDLDNVR